LGTLSLGKSTIGTGYAMRKVLISLCLTGVTLFVASLAGPSMSYGQGAEAFSIEERGRLERDVDVAKLYDSVVETVDQRFYDEGILKTLGRRARAQALRPSVLSAAAPQDTVRRINGLLSELKTSHTNLFTPDDYEYYCCHTQAAPIRCWMRLWSCWPSRKPKLHSS
jgi:hypothetical protein